MSANEQQVGGSHYRTGALQHWDLVAKYRLGYFEAQVTRYLSRYNRKNGLEDVKKARHYVAKMIELEESGYVFADHRRTGTEEAAIKRDMEEFMDANGLKDQRVRMTCLCMATLINKSILVACLYWLDGFISDMARSS